MLEDPDLRNGLKLLGNLTDSDIDDLGTYGKGPEITVTCDDEIFNGSSNGCSEVNGTFALLKNEYQSSSFLLSQTLVEQFENATPESKQATLLLIVSTILHEAIHVGKHEIF